MITAAAPSSTPTDQSHTLDESDLRQFCVLVARGCTIKQAARCVGCTLADVRRERVANEQFRRKLAQAKIKHELAPLRALQRAMKKDWRAAAWFLERTQPEKFGRRNHRGFTQKQANALIKDVTSIIGEESISKGKFDRTSSRVEAAIRYAFNAHNDMNRTAAEMGRAMKHHDMKSPRYSPTLAYPDFIEPKPNAAPRSAPAPSSSRTTSSPLASSASANLPPRAPATPTGRTIAQMIVNIVDKQVAGTQNATSPPNPPQPLASSASSNPTSPTPPHRTQPLGHRLSAG